ncbi:MAG TPA: glycosyltransferase family 4 protein [Candidatus Binataceae bacterium]|nr:glycosyltransferase family 4 protein [Candidatus Binataceae bacterium]
MTRVLIIAYTTYAHDGRVKRQAEALSSRGDSVDVICLSSGPVSDARGVTIVGIEIPRYRGGSRASYVLSYLKFFARAGAIALRRSYTGPYDVVIVCTMPDEAILSALPCRLFGSRTVLDIHDTMPELYLDKFDDQRGRFGARLLMAGERMSAWFADRVLAVHNLHAERLCQAGIPAHKIVVVTNGPDPRIFKPAKLDGFTNGSGAAAPQSPFTLVCHGTVTHRLGLDTAVEAMALVRHSLADVRLRIIGAGDYLGEIKALCRRLELDSMVTFEDPVPIHQLPGRLSSAAVGLVPNHATSATQLMLPVKLLEFATLGIPAIASRLRTIEHYFDDSAVRYFTPGDSRDLAQAIEDLYHNPQRRSALSRRAALEVSKLSWARQSRRYFEAVDSLLVNRKEQLCAEKR